MAEACLFAIRPAGDALLVAHATPGLRDAVASLHIPVGAGVSGWVAANRSTIRSAGPALDVGTLADVFGLRVSTSTPVFARGELFGVLTAYGADATRFSDHAVAAVGNLAQEVGLMIAYAEAKRADDSTLTGPVGVSMAAAS